jgi:hypothetical protein
VSAGIGALRGEFDAAQPGRRLSTSASSEYLRLRQEKMSDFAHARYSALNPIYERYRRGALTEDDLAHLDRLLTVVERRHPLLSLNALQTAYEYHRLILGAARKIESDEKRKYLLSLDEYLRVNPRFA